MARGGRYYTLIASLPALPKSFEVDRVPITQPRLEQRLQMLKPKDAEVVAILEAFLLWDRQRLHRTDEKVVHYYRDLLSRVANPLARQIVDFRMDIRTIMSGLQRRRRALSPPPGVGQWVDHIRRNWEHPDFKLGWEHPWIAEVNRLLGATECLSIERTLMKVAWNRWNREAERHDPFSFEALLLYLARWEMINRWVNMDATIGRNRFDELVTEALDEYVDLYG